MPRKQLRILPAKPLTKREINELPTQTVQQVIDSVKHERLRPKWKDVAAAVGCELTDKG